MAGAFFNDVFMPTPPKNETNQTTVSWWSETGIAWQADHERSFRNPKMSLAGWDYEDEVAKGPSSMYHLLHQQFPRFPRLKEEGVENEHFIVWMRNSGLTNAARKLYAILDKDLSAGDMLDVWVRSEWDVKRFGGTKALVLANVHPQLGPYDGGVRSMVVTVLGAVLLAGAAALAVASRTLPRNIVMANGIVYQAPLLNSR